MSARFSIRTIDCHVAGAPLRLILEGVPPLEGDSLADRQTFLETRHDRLRRSLVCEPRGHADMTGVVLTAPTSPEAQIGMLFIQATGYSSFCGHGLIGGVTLAVERGLFVADTYNPLVVDTAAGPVHTRPEVVSGTGGVRVAKVAYRSHPAFVVAGGVRGGAEGHEPRLDIVWADGLYALADGEALGVRLVPDHLPTLRSTALALLRQVDVRRFARLVPAGRPLRLEGLVLLAQASSEADVRSVTVYADGVVDRSPSGSGTTAVVAVLDAMGLVDDGRRIVHESLWGTRLTARIAGRRHEGARVSIEVEVEGSAWLTGEHVFVFEPDDPLREGFDGPVYGSLAR